MLEEILSTATDQFHNLAMVIFSEDLDFITKLMTVWVILTLSIEFTYVLLPPPLKRAVISLDRPPHKEGESSRSSKVAVFNLIVLLVVTAQKFSYSKSSEEKLLESRIEREFRHRTQFLADMHIY